MANQPKNYGRYFQEKFGRPATREDLTRLLDSLFNEIPTKETALVPLNNPLSNLVEGVQETSPEITLEIIDETLESMHKEEQKADYNVKVKAQKRNWLFEKLAAPAILAGVLAIGAGVFYFSYQHVKKEAYEFEPTESLMKVEAPSTIPKEILDAYAEHHNILEARPNWARNIHDKTIFDETINDVRIVAKTFLGGRIMGRFHHTINDFLVLYQYGPTGLASMHFYDGSWNNDMDEIVDDAKPFTSIFFNRDNGDRKGKRLIEANFYDEIFEELNYYGKEDADGDGWGGVTYYGAVPDGKIEPYYELSEKFLEEFQELYEKYKGKRFIVENPI